MIESLDKTRLALLIKPSSFGDVVHAFPVVSALKRSVPDIEIDWVVADQYVDLVRMSPNVRKIFPFQRKQWAKWWQPKTISSISRCVKKIREQRYGVVLDLQGLFRSGVITFLSRSKTKVGFKSAREGAPIIYNIKVPVADKDSHAIKKNMSVLNGIGLNTGSKIEFDLVIPKPETIWAETVIPKSPFVVINPNTRWESKKWPLKKFGLLSRRLYDERGLLTVTIGGHEDREMGSQINAIAGNCVTDLTGRGGIVHLAAILKKSVGLVTSDSGPLHLAVALGVPTVSIFGPTNPLNTGPYGNGHKVIRNNIICSPCYSRECHVENHVCMETVSIDSVIKACDSFVNSTSIKI